LQALREEPESFGAAEEEFADISLEDVAKRLRPSDDSFVLGALAPALIGTVGFHRREGVKKRHKGIIWGVYVAPERRGQGIARSLMRAAISRASSLAGLDSLSLTVALKNEAARNFYLSLGFSTYGVDRRAMKLGAEYLDEELMELLLATDEHR
jgi:ribosomal protein S18 acetylase RimI-like enzyme